MTWEVTDKSLMSFVSAGARRRNEPSPPKVFDVPQAANEAEAIDIYLKRSWQFAIEKQLPTPKKPHDTQLSARFVNRPPVRIFSAKGNLLASCDETLQGAIDGIVAFQVRATRERKFADDPKAINDYSEEFLRDYATYPHAFQDWEIFADPESPVAGLNGVIIRDEFALSRVLSRIREYLLSQATQK